MDRPQPARHSARAQKSCVLRLLPRDSQRSGPGAVAVAHVRVPRQSRLHVGGRSWHVAPRPRAETERPLAGAVPSHRAWADHNQHGTAHARRKLACCASCRGTRALLFRRVCPKLARKQLTGWVAGLFVYAQGHQKAPPVPYLGRVRCVRFGSAHLDAPGCPPGRMAAGVVPSWHGRFLCRIMQTSLRFVRIVMMMTTACIAHTAMLPRGGCKYL